MSVSYEWKLEQKDEHGDIQHSEFESTLKKVTYGLPLEHLKNGNFEVCLVRDNGPYAMFHRRQYAYMVLDQTTNLWLLNCYDETGMEPPKRFDKEVEAFNKRMGLI